MQDARVVVEDPHRDDVRALLGRHLAFCTATSPPEDVHALDVSGLAAPDVTLYGLRVDGVLLGVAALRQLDGAHGELKSMHTAEQARGRGVGSALLEHVLREAAARGLQRVSLETGTQAEFAPARELYARAGFVPCGPFADYLPSPASTFLTRTLASPA